MLADLKQLTNTEALTVFDAVKSRIIGSSDLSKLPAGVDGLNTLVKAHSELQSNLLDFLDSLPLDKCGNWITIGWEAVLIDLVHKQSFSDLLEKWAKYEKNKLVSLTAKNILKSKK